MAKILAFQTNTDKKIAVSLKFPEAWWPFVVLPSAQFTCARLCAFRWRGAAVPDVSGMESGKENTMNFVARRRSDSINNRKTIR